MKRTLNLWVESQEEEKRTVQLRRNLQPKNSTNYIVQAVDFQ